ncbi:hypothetical protein [Ottowia thiooxydans]|uniref:Uncharacterized protein n=1 Tax=Ottowia thiooxydans TaxID=219182 RepID=A0ABV2QHF6_9BURK
MISVVQYWHQPDYCPPAIRSRQNQWRSAFPEQYELFDRRTAADCLHAHFGQEVVSGFLACGVPAMASDYFRYHRLAITGGLYVDSSFLPGDLARIISLTGHPLFALSVPKVDLTPGIAQARQVLGKVLLNGVLWTKSAPSPYFSLLSALVRRLVHERSSNQIPMVTGIAVLTMFDYAVSASEKNSVRSLENIRLALPPGNERFLAVTLEFLQQHTKQLSELTPCAWADSEDMKDVFHRPAEDHSRLADPAHWTNHQGDIFTATS